MSTKQNPDITILCRVVDNFGDIGVVYRLARALTELDCRNLRIIVDNLDSFSLLAPGIDTNANIQSFNSWTIIRWNEQNNDAVRLFTERPPQVIIECFACGRPDWLENILFTPGRTDVVHIINLEYLTAEPYADEFHKLQSLTRSSKVQKVNFMPGFTPQTGGLILDEQFMSALRNRLVDTDSSENASEQSALVGEHAAQVGKQATLAGEQSAQVVKQAALAGKHAAQVGKQATLAGEQSAQVVKQSALVGEHAAQVGKQATLAGEQSAQVVKQAALAGKQAAQVGKQIEPSTDEFPVVVFSYERDFTAVVKSMSDTLSKVVALQNKTLTVYAAAGKSWTPFYSAWKLAGKPFTVVELPFLAQKEWDALLCKAKFLFIRGEDSLSRACLAGVPFVWHAYPQSDNYQLVKVRALLERMKPFFSVDDFEVLSAYWLFYNGAESETASECESTEKSKMTCECESTEKSKITSEYEATLLRNLFERYNNIEQGFVEFSEMLKKNGNLASHLMTFILEMV